MTYKEFHDTILNSSPSDWRSNGERYIFMPDIDISMEGSFDDRSVPDMDFSHEELRERFGEGHISTSKYRLSYRGEFITGSRFVSSGRSGTLGIVAVPFPLGFTDEHQGETVYASRLDHHVCFLLSELFGEPVGKETYDKALERARVKIVPYEDGIWYLEC